MVISARKRHCVFEKTFFLFMSIYQTCTRGPLVLGKCILQYYLIWAYGLLQVVRALESEINKEAADDKVLNAEILVNAGENENLDDLLVSYLRSDRIVQAVEFANVSVDTTCLPVVKHEDLVQTGNVCFFVKIVFLTKLLRISRPRVYNPTLGSHDKQNVLQLKEVMFIRMYVIF